MAFTNPCIGCVQQENGNDCSNWRKCSRYRYWLNYCMKCARIAAKKCARIAAKGKPREIPKTTKWAYNHPDENRKYINEGVCAKCPLSGNCDEPCGYYWDWWDARMEIARKRVRA